MKWTSRVHNGGNFYVNFYHAHSERDSFMIADHSKRKKVDVFCNCNPIPRLRCDTVKEAMAKVNYLAAHSDKM